jgi:hypothetical protein
LNFVERGTSRYSKGKERQDSPAEPLREPCDRDTPLVAHVVCPQGRPFTGSERESKECLQKGQGAKGNVSTLSEPFHKTPNHPWRSGTLIWEEPGRDRGIGGTGGG